MKQILCFSQGITAPGEGSARPPGDAARGAHHHHALLSARHGAASRLCRPAAAALQLQQRRQRHGDGRTDHLQPLQCFQSVRHQQGKKRHPLRETKTRGVLKCVAVRNRKLCQTTHTVCVSDKCSKSSAIALHVLKRLLSQEPSPAKEPAGQVSPVMEARRNLLSILPRVLASLSTLWRAVGVCEERQSAVGREGPWTTFGPPKARRFSAHV